jgi:hypothetical protein
MSLVSCWGTRRRRRRKIRGEGGGKYKREE